MKAPLYLTQFQRGHLRYCLPWLEARHRSLALHYNNSLTSLITHQIKVFILGFTKPLQVLRTRRRKVPNRTTVLSPLEAREHVTDTLNETLSLFWYSSNSVTNLLHKATLSSCVCAPVTEVVACDPAAVAEEEGAGVLTLVRSAGPV